MAPFAAQLVPNPVPGGPRTTKAPLSRGLSQPIDLVDLDWSSGGNWRMKFSGLIKNPKEQRSTSAVNFLGQGGV